MKTKIKVILISLFVIAVIAIGVYIGSINGLLNIWNNNEIKNSELLLCKTTTELENFANDNKYELFTEDNATYIYSVKLFDYMADVSVANSESLIEYIKVDIQLLEIQYPENSTDDEYVAHDFTDKEKEKANELYEEIKKIFELFLNCGELSYYDTVSVNYGNVSESLSEEERFYEGYDFREYSVKDSDGVIWLLRLYASDYNTSASILKIIDTNEYEGFIPIIDMTK